MKNDNDEKTLFDFIPNYPNKGKNKTFVALILFVVNFLVILIYYFVNFKLIFCIFISIIYFLSIYFIYSKIKFNENL